MFASERHGIMTTGCGRCVLVSDVEGEVDIHGLVIEVVLEGLFARGEGLGDLVARAVVGRGGELGLKLGLERPANIQELRVRKVWLGEQRNVPRAGWGKAAHRFISIIISERASPQLANSAGCRLTWAREKSRTLIWASTCVLTSGKMFS